MKKLLILLVVFSFVLSGCSSNSNVDKSVNDDVNSSKERTNFESPEDKADIVGIVESITGNEVVILKIEMGDPSQNLPENAESEKKSTETEGKTLSLTGTGTMGGPGGGMGGKRPEGSFDENSRSEMLEKIKEMSNGSETVLIPVGIKMLKTDSETRAMVEANLTDVVVDQMINIWLNDEITDRKIAEFVIIK